MLINDASITGSLIVNASASFQNISVGGNIIPDETNIRNLGSTDKYFKEIYVSTGSINFVDETGVVGTLNAGTITAIQSNTSSANSRLDSVESVSASLQSFTASISATNTFTSSATARLNALETTSASVDTLNTNQNNRLGSLETVSASNISRISALETTSASVDTLNTTQNTRLTNLEIKTGSLATTGSNTFIGTQTITGSLFISANLVVQGTSSLENITASAVSIGTNIVNLNTANPAIRYAGLVIGDSGSVGGSGSFLYDSVQDEMIFVHRGTNTTVTSSVVLMGPQTFDNIGTETYPTANRIQKGTGNEHLVDSCIIDNGTTTCITNNLIVTGTACFASTMCVPRLQVFNTNSIIVIEGTSTNGEGTLTIAGKNSSGTSRSAIFKYDNADIIRVATADAIPIRFETSDVTRMTIASNGISTFACQIQTNGGCVTVNKGDGTPAVLQLGNAQNSFQIQFTCTGGQRIAFINGAPTEFASFFGTGVACFASTVCTPELMVNSGVRLYGSSGGIGCAYIVTATGTNEQPAILLEKAGGFGQAEIRTYYTNVPNYGMAFRAGSGITAMYIQCQGRIGIGTSTPEAPLTIRCDSSSSAAFMEIATCFQNAYRYVSINGGTGISFCIPGGTSQSPFIEVQGGDQSATGGAFRIRTGAMGSVTDKLNIAQNGVACFASNVCAASLSTNAGGLTENFIGTGGGHVSRYFAAKYIPENTTQAFFRITTSGASATQIHLAGTNAGVGWYSGQIYHAANTAYWGGWIGSGASVSLVGASAGYISGVYSDGAGGQNYCVTVANNGTGTSSLIFAYITTITYGGYSTSFTQL